MVTLEFAEDGSCVCMYVCTVCTSNGRVLQSTQLEYIKHEGIYVPRDFGNSATLGSCYD